MRLTHRPLLHALVPLLLGLLGLVQANADGLTGRTIDLQEPVDLLVIGDVNGDHLGYAVAVGDWDGDGRDDLAIGAPDADPTFNIAGKVYVFFGRDGLPSLIDLRHTQPDVEIWGGQEESRLGFELASGDVNGDGIDDLLATNLNGEPPGRVRGGSGTVSVFFGGAWDRPLINLIEESPDAEVWGAVGGEHAGTHLALGDLNDDGIQDLVLAAPLSDRPSPGDSNTGAVYVVWGRRDLSGVIDLAYQADVTILGAVADDRLGSDIATGDVNGDGVTDLIVGANGFDAPERRDTGAVYVFYGGDALQGTIDLRQRTPDLLLWGGADEYVGSAVAAGDINGDGVADVVTGGPGAAPAGRARAGVVYAVLGSPGAQATLDLTTDADVTVWGAAEWRMGDGLGIWDLDDDGFAELLINAPQAGLEDRPAAGLLAVLRGQPTPPALIDLASQEADIAIWGAFIYHRLRWDLAVGDLNDNGTLDLLVTNPDGKPQERNRAGAVFGLYDLSPSPPTATPTASPTATMIATVTPTASASATPTLTATPSPTSTATPEPVWELYMPMVVRAFGPLRTNRR